MLFAGLIMKEQNVRRTDPSSCMEKPPLGCFIARNQRYSALLPCDNRIGVRPRPSVSR